MKKYKKMVLAGILLSSTILGANTSVVQAASSNKALSVDTSSIANNVIQVINDLLNSSSTANKVNSQTKFSDLEKEGASIDVAPIFGRMDSSDFEKTLKGELNVVDDSEQLVPMTVVTTNSTTGFITKVSYTLNGTTKNVKVNYTYSMPTVSFNNNQTMNFSSTDASSTVNSVATNTSSVTVNTTNGSDSKGNVNKTAVKSSQSGNTVTFTPSDSYISGISATRNINLYTEPDWTKLNNTGTTRTVTSSDDLNQPSIIVNSNGQMYSVTASNITPSSDEKSADVDYKATAIDSKGNTVNDDSTGDPITYSKKSASVTIDSASIYPTVTYMDGNNTVYTNNFGKETAAGTISAADVQAALPTGYTLNTPSDFAYTATDYTKTYSVSKDVATKVNFISVSDGNNVGTSTLTGKNGSTTTLNAPENYQLVNSADILQTLNADQPTKDIYVKPTADIKNNLSYKVTFKDKTTGAKIGTDVNGTGSFGTYISLTAPSDYAFASIIDNGFILLKNNQNVTKYVVAANTPYNISYVDQDTGKEVGTQAGKGVDGSKIVLKAPSDYAFVNADDINYTIDKDTTKSTVYVQKADKTNIVSGYPKNGYIKIYDPKGKLNDNVVLSEGSSWIVDKTVTIDNAEYYRVATDEYVKASDVYKYTPLQTIATTNGTNVTPVYNSRGQVIIDRALDTNTPWYTDRSATIKGQKMYRVATDEWIRASDATLK